MSQTPAIKRSRNESCPCGSGRKYKQCCLIASTPSPDGLLHLALQHQQANRLPQAEAIYRRILQQHPNHPDALHYLGLLAHQLGQLDSAVALILRAIQANPNNAACYTNLGSVLQQQGRLDDAVAAHQAAIRLNPQRPEFHLNLALVLHQQRKFIAAADACRAALTLAPHLPEAHFNLANALQGQGHLASAISAYQRALELNPTYAEAHNNLGRALQEQADIPAAAAHYEQAIALNPHYTEAFSNLIYLHAFAHDISPEAQLPIAARWEQAALSAAARAAARTRTFSNAPRAHRKLRLGIVSAELGQHAVAEFLQPLLEHLDRDRFHLTLYPTVAHTGDRATQLQQLADQFTPLSHLSDADAAALIRRDAIDVLIDTTGHTSHSRLAIFAHRAAPVQCTYIGFWASTGLTEMDYYIHDHSLPASCDAHFTERLWRLPRLANAYRGDRSLPITPRQHDGTLWLGSFNKYSKIRHETLALWAKVLHAIPHARLLLEDRTPFDHQHHARILSELQRHGVSSSRLEFAPHTPGWRSHMLLYNRLDIALDTVPFNSGTTAYDALWMGVPLIALEGNRGGGRMTTAVLRALGRPEWVARTDDEYVAKVATLAHDDARLSSIRRTQRELMASSPLCDGHGLASALADAFESMFDCWHARHSH